MSSTKKKINPSKATMTRKRRETFIDLAFGGGGTGSDDEEDDE
jgi:hypothetical protein